MSYYDDGTWWVDYVDLSNNTVVRQVFPNEQEAVAFYNLLI